MECRFAVLFLCFLMLMSAGCRRGGRNPEQPGTAADTVVVAPPAVRDTVPAWRWYSPPVRQWFSARATAKVPLDKMGSVDVNLFAVVAKDSLIYLHVSKFGMELARVLCAPDSIVALLHTEQAYWKGDYSVFRRRLGVPMDFSTLQGLLLVHPEGMRVVSDSAGFLRQIRWVERDSILRMEVSYRRYAPVSESEGLLYPMDISISLPRVESSARLAVKSVNVEVPGPVSLRIPTKYKRISW